MIEHPEALKPGDRVALTVTKVDEWRVHCGDGHYISHEWLRANADLLPEPPPEWEQEILRKHERARNDLVDMDLLRQVAVELRNMVAKGKSWWLDDLRAYAATIESCLPQTEPPYVDPEFHPGMLVQAEDGTGPMWVYLPDDESDDQPFRRLEVRRPFWDSRQDLPNRLRTVYIDSGGQVRPVKEAGE